MPWLGICDASGIHECAPRSSRTRPRAAQVLATWRARPWRSSPLTRALPERVLDRDELGDDSTGASDHAGGNAVAAPRARRRGRGVDDAPRAGLAIHGRYVGFPGWPRRSVRLHAGRGGARPGGRRACAGTTVRDRRRTLARLAGAWAAGGRLSRNLRGSGSTARPSSRRTRGSARGLAPAARRARTRDAHAGRLHGSACRGRAVARRRTARVLGSLDHTLPRTPAFRHALLCAVDAAGAM